VQVLKRSPQTLFALAQDRAIRRDLGDTATWHIGTAGPKIVLIHGFRGDHHGLMGLAGALPEAQFVIPDLPGFGKTPPLASKHDLAGYARWLIEFLSELGPYDALLGHSFGSLVVSKAVDDGLQAPRLILQNPITTRAIEVDTLPNRIANYYYRIGSKAGSNLLRSQAAVRLMSIGLTKTLSPSLRRFIHRQHSNYFSSFANNQMLLEAYQAARESSVLDYCSSFPERLLLIAGDKDLVAPIAGQRMLAEQTEGELVELPRVGHLTHYERPAEVAVAIGKFLERD